MEFLSIARVLARRRLFLGLAVLTAVAFGVIGAGALAPSGAGSSGSTGEALAQVLVDTRVPLVATTTVGGTTTIVQRAVLLADLMGSDAMTATIAQRAGIAPGSLTVVGPAFAPVVEANSVAPDGQLAQLAAAAAQSQVRTPYVATLTANYNLPVVSIGVSAPSARGADSLVQALVTTMQAATVPTNGTGRAQPQPALSISQLGTVRSVALAKGGLHWGRGIGIAVVLFALCCAGIVIAAGVARRWRRLGRPSTQLAG